MKLDREFLLRFAEYRASAMALIAVNSLPLFGVIFLGWNAFEIVALYWTENLVIGAINVLKIITCCPDPATVEWAKPGSDNESTEVKAAIDKLRAGIAGGKLNHHLSKFFFVPFFTVHYGFFCLVHGVFVLQLLGPGNVGAGLWGPFEGMFRTFSQQHLWWCVSALAASHLYSFFVNYLGHGEYRRTIAPILMAQPYARIVVLHIALLFGGWIAMALGSNIGVLVILIAGKTVLDLALHLCERALNAAPTAAVRSGKNRPAKAGASHQITRQAE